MGKMYRFARITVVPTQFAPPPGNSPSGASHLCTARAFLFFLDALYWNYKNFAFHSCDFCADRFLVLCGDRAGKPLRHSLRKFRTDV